MTPAQDHKQVFLSISLSLYLSISLSLYLSINVIALAIDTGAHVCMYTYISHL